MPYSLKDTINNLSINALKEKFSDYKQCSLKEILDFYRLKEPLIKKTTVQWRVTRLLELGIIQRIGRGKYKVGKYKKFEPYSTKQIMKAHHYLTTQFPDAKYCIWSTEWLKDYLPELDVKVIFIEGIGKYPSSFFFHLWEQKYCTVYYELPTRVSKMYYKNIIIIRKMISGSPLVESGEITYPHLEKIIVDLYCGLNSIYPYDKPTFQQLFKKLHKDFSINESKLLRYADRRKKKETFAKYLKKLKH